jgi:phytoene dehydrogenase-like protein
VRIDEDGFLDSIDVRSNLAFSVRLSTAADMSARFTYVSPAGRFTNGQHVVDGGYFENSGTATASDILDTISKLNATISTNADVVAIVISNDPNAAKARSRPGKPSDFLHETLSPISTLLNTRDARGIYSENDLNSREDLTFYYSFGLTNGGVPLPLGWALSQQAMTNMNQQLDGQAQKIGKISQLLSR